ncbi:hypothetical protein [Amycolatopsis sp. CA-230715]|uniref:hypothetical protein n=1 Tax=Amycolatopsis sp. CA-230715 TaxID=2745196 RepID=UPI001C0261D9|nr:hypothetical protein [Amycolatopsis sp. CA-230715]
MKQRLISAIGATVLTAVVGVSAAPAAFAAPEPAGHVVVANDRNQAYEQLIATAIHQNSPNATPGDIERIIAAFKDIGVIISKVNPTDVGRVGNGVAQAAAAIAEFQATGNVDALRQAVCGGGNAVAGSMSILSGVVRMYEESANLPQIAEILDSIDPRTPEGGKLFDALPDFAKTPEAKAALVSLSEFGRTLNKIDKQKVILLAKDWGEAASTCDISTVIAIPGLMVRTWDLGQEIIGILLHANLGEMSAILNPRS